MLDDTPVALILTAHQAGVTRTALANTIRRKERSIKARGLSSDDPRHATGERQINSLRAAEAITATALDAIVTLRNRPIAPPDDRSELTVLIAKAVAVYEKMPPERRDALLAAQRESWVRGEIELSRMERQTTRHTAPLDRPSDEPDSDAPRVNDEPERTAVPR